MTMMLVSATSRIESPGGEAVRQRIDKASFRSTLQGADEKRAVKCSLIVE